MSITLTREEQVANALKMIPQKRLATVEEVIALIADQRMDPRINRYRSASLYRGLPNSSYGLVTSLQRNCKEKQFDVESSILRNFAKYAASEEPQINESVWRQMVIGQHHGLPTRLLDWTYSPLVALHFALNDDNMEGMTDHDCCIWKIDIEEIHSLLPPKYFDIIQREHAYLFTVDMLEQAADDLTDYDIMMGDHSLVLLEPPSIDQRIVNQYSYFSVTPKNITCMEEFLAQKTTKTVRYIIDKDLRWRLRDMLDQANMNERTMFPGLDGLAAWLKRHYYVK